MPIIIPPELEQAAQDQVQRFQDTDSQLTQAAGRRQGEIDGTAGLPPGLQAAEALNASIYSQYGGLIAPYESERRALDGLYATPAVTESDITQAATSRSGVLFPVDNLTLIPTRVDWLDGLGGSDAVNEQAKLAVEANALGILALLAEVLRPLSSSYTDWQDSLNAQLALLHIEATAIGANEAYGPLHQAYLNVQAEIVAVEALLPDPPYTNGDLGQRQAQVAARQAQVAARIPVLDVAVQVLYDARFLVLKGRVHLILGSLAKLISTQNGITTIESIQGLNSGLLDLYNQLV